jgi:uncharacterized protein YciI
MFVSLLTYNRPISREEPLFQAHRAFIEHQVATSAVLCSGPRVGVNGGLLIAYGDDEAAIRAVLDQDPFVIDGVASYELHQFTVGLADPASSLAAGA